MSNVKSTGVWPYKVLDPPALKCMQNSASNPYLRVQLANLTKVTRPHPSCADKAGEVLDECQPEVGLPQLTGGMKASSACETE